MSTADAPTLAADEVRAAIRRAALALVEAGGVSAATSRAVASRALGAAESRLLYAYYGSMDDLLTDVADEALAGVESLAQLSLAAGELVIRHASEAAWREYLREGGTATDVGACVLRARMGGV